MKKYLFTILMLFILTIQAQINNEHLEIGDDAPNISGIDQNGQAINSDKILRNDKILLVFYRGYWCPHCRKHLASLQENFKALTDKGVYVIVVTPETIEKTQETSKKLNTGFSIVHDVDNKIMKDYKVAFEVNKENIPNYYSVVSKRVVAYNVENNNVLPVPATYLIDKNGKITYVQYDPNYKNRSDFNEILESL
ncbi:MAG: peroxiredoxin-like family protein [Bacteroidota bacterium]